jgi:hypothetical protein
LLLLSYTSVRLLFFPVLELKPLLILYNNTTSTFSFILDIGACMSCIVLVLVIMLSVLAVLPPLILPQSRLSSHWVASKVWG